MNILFLGYWNISDPLTSATVYPSLKILQEFDFVERILFVNTERASSDPVFDPGFETPKISYQPLFSRNLEFNLFNKVNDFIYFPSRITELVRSHTINVIIARGAPAGALAYLSWKTTHVPFIVESFEPHADYMLESGVWKKYDPRFLFQVHWEKMQKKYATALLTVSNKYRSRLMEEGVPKERIGVAPCMVDTEHFHFDPQRRAALRTELAIPQQAIVGVYAGRYGGLYLDQQAFDLYSQAFNVISNFYLIILSPESFHPWIEKMITDNALPKNRVIVRSVPHREMSGYLSVADIAFATYKPGDSKAFLSPVKVGEYWACGLPVLLTRGVGDESDIIEQQGIGGDLFNPESINPDVFGKVLNAIKKADGREINRKLAIHYRSPSLVRASYAQFLVKFR